MSSARVMKWMALWVVMACLWGALRPEEARADVVIGIEVDAGFAPQGWTVEPGGVAWLFNGRIGYGIDLFFVHLIPELSAGYGSFPEDDQGNPKQTLFFVKGGARVKVPVIPLVSPGAYVHVGYGEVEGTASDFTVQAVGMMFDVAAVLTFEPLPLFGIGVQVGYAGVFDTDRDETSGWVHAGGHFELSF